MEEVRSNLMEDVDTLASAQVDEAMIQARASLTRRFLSGKLTYKEYRLLPRELKRKYRENFPRPKNENDRRTEAKRRRQRRTRQAQQKAGRKAALWGQR